MKKRPILFNAEMVNAILEGRKTQTRRIVKNQPLDKSKSCFVIESTDRQQIGTFRFSDINHENPVYIRCPHGSAGDQLWVKETYAVGVCSDRLKPSELSPRFHLVDNGGIWYEADTTCPKSPVTEKGKIRPSLFIPKWASRINLIIDSISSQRLHDINQDDAIAEGIELVEHNCFKNYLTGPPNDERPGYEYLEDPIGSFRSLWKSINGIDSWNSNPWVWVIRFTSKSEISSELDN